MGSDRKQGKGTQVNLKREFEVSIHLDRIEITNDSQTLISMSLPGIGLPTRLFGLAVDYLYNIDAICGRKNGSSCHSDQDCTQVNYKQKDLHIHVSKHIITLQLKALLR